MDFGDSPSRIESNNINKKLNLVGTLIDMKISIEKLDKEIILTEDGILYKLEV